MLFICECVFVYMHIHMLVSMHMCVSECGGQGLILGVIFDCFLYLTCQTGSSQSQNLINWPICLQNSRIASSQLASSSAPFVSFPDTKLSVGLWILATMPGFSLMLENQTSILMFLCSLLTGWAIFTVPSDYLCTLILVHCSYNAFWWVKYKIFKILS